MHLGLDQPSQYPHLFTLNWSGKNKNNSLHYIVSLIRVQLILSRHLPYFLCVIGSSHQSLLQAYRIPMDFLTFSPSSCQPSHAICSG